jgi:hypothetical protein
MFSAAHVRTYNLVKYGRAKSAGMEGGPPLQSLASETTLARSTYTTKWAIKISVHELEFKCKLEIIWNKNQKLLHL